MIKVSQGCLGEEEHAALVGVFASGRYGHSPKTAEFETALAKFLSAKNVVAVNTGTSALHLALDALGIGIGDEVILPSLTFIGVFQAVLATGAKPIACDVDPVTLSLDLKDVETRITSRTKAVMPMHYAGQSCGMDEFLALKKKTGIRIVEDAAHAFGSTDNGRLIGSFGDVTCFSFDSIKNITCGDGGAITCSDTELAETLRIKRHVGIQKRGGENSSAHPWEFDTTAIGYRYHMGSIPAAIGMVQLKRFPEFAKRRQNICKKYVEAFKDISQIGIIPTDYNATVPHVFVIRIKNGKRDELIKSLLAQDIEPGINYVPNHTLSLFRQEGFVLPATESAFREIITLPLHCNMTDADVAKVAGAVKRFFV